MTGRDAMKSMKKSVLATIVLALAAAGSAVAGINGGYLKTNGINGGYLSINGINGGYLVISSTGINGGY
jgi:hypothetical protein